MPIRWSIHYVGVVWGNELLFFEISQPTLKPSYILFCFNRVIIVIAMRFKSLLINKKVLHSLPKEIEGLIAIWKLMTVLFSIVYLILFTRACSTVGSCPIPEVVDSNLVT